MGLGIAAILAAAAAAVAPALGGAGRAEAERPPKVVVLGVTGGEGFTEKLLGSIDELVQEAIHDAAGFSVIGRGDIAALLGLERQKQLSGCAAEMSCVAEIGGSLGADFIVVTDVARFGSNNVVNMKLIEVRHAAVLVRVLKRAPVDADFSLAVEAAAHEAVAQLLALRAKASPPKAVAAPQTPPAQAAVGTAKASSASESDSRPATVAVDAAKGDVKPAPPAPKDRFWTWIALGGAAVALAAGAWYGFELTGDMDVLGAGKPLDDPDGKIAKAGRDLTARNVLLGTGGGLAAGATVLFVLHW